MKAVVVLSGGMDSTTLLHYAKKTLARSCEALVFDYGQRHRKEVEIARENAIVACVPVMVHPLDFFCYFSTSALTVGGRGNTGLKVPNIEDVLGHPQPVTYVPNRNMIMLSIAVAWAEERGAEEVYYGAQKHDLYSYWDTTEDFVDSMNRVIQLNRMKPIRIVAPFINMSKSEILSIGLKLGVDYSKTTSCYNGRDKACGTCPTCAERLKAFRDLGMKDPIPYEQTDGGTESSQEASNAS